MAKGTDSDEFVSMSESEPRSGLKRELSSQSELPIKERTNPSNNVIFEYTRKRFRKTGGGTVNSLKKEESLTKLGNISSPIEKQGLENGTLDNGIVLNAPVEMNLQDNVPSVVESQNESVATPNIEEVRGNVETLLTSSSTPSAVQSNELALFVDGGNASNEAKNVDEEAFRELVCCLRSPFCTQETSGPHKSTTVKPLKRFTRSGRKQKKDCSVVQGNVDVLRDQALNQFKSSDSEVKVSTVLNDGKEEYTGSLVPSIPTNVEFEAQMPLVNDSSYSQQAPKVGDSKDHVCRIEVGTDTESPTVIDYANEGPDTSGNNSRRRFTRSALQISTPPEMIDASLDSQQPLESNSEEVVIGDGHLQNTSRDNPLESKIEHMMIDNNSETQGASPVKPGRRFSRLALECMTKSQLVNMLQSTSLDTPLRRFTRSALASKNESKAMEENSQAQTTLSEKLLKRFTRSTLNVKDDSAEMLDTETSCGSHGLSEKVQRNEQTANTPNQTTDIISPIRTPSSKKLEMKMSKKITLTKFPSKINELLETGMLESLSVKYVFHSQKKGVLQGVIKDGGILCSCILCKGCKVVSPTQFERHAGSTNRNPALYIYLDNGNNIRDVLNACKDAPRDMLEATIQMAITSSVKNAVCLNCKRPKKTRRALGLCNSCLELKKSQSSSSFTPPSVTRSKQFVTPKESDDAPMCVSPHDKSSRGKLTRKDLRLHKLVFEKDGLPDGTELGYYVQGKKLLEGYKKGFGIFCFCCNSEISPSQFEAHAGWAQRRKPYLHIYTSNGVSLHELSISLSKGRKFSAKDNDDLCGICGDFGDLLLCDGCPRAFHKDCVGQPSVPRGKWYCTYCQTMFQQEQAFAHNANALAAGRVSGVDPIEQITKRCIRIVKTPEPELGGCTLCWVPGFSKSGFGPRTIILCDQCEKEFHVGCLRDHKLADLKELPKGKWFCTKGCCRISIALEKCVLRGPEELPDSITKLLKMKPEEPSRSYNISWRLLSGKVASPESRSLLSKAVAIFYNRFDPIVDAVTGRDLIPCMVYGRNIREQEFAGMFCAVLTVNSSVVSAGLIRVLGQEVAELPLVATSSDYQGQGYFHSLFCCIERLLGFLNVKTLVLPAAEEAEAIWTQKFGFQKMNPDQVTKYTKEYQLTVFRGTAVLHKPVPKCRIIRQSNENR